MLLSNLSEELQYSYLQLLTFTPFEPFKKLELICDPFMSDISINEGNKLANELIKIGLLEERTDKDGGLEIKRKRLPDEPNYPIEILRLLKENYLQNEPKDLKPLLCSFQDKYWRTDMDIRIWLSGLDDNKYALIGGRLINDLRQEANWGMLGAWLRGKWIKSHLNIRKAIYINGIITTKGLQYLSDFEKERNLLPMQNPKNIQIPEIIRMSWYNRFCKFCKKEWKFIIGTIITIIIAIVGWRLEWVLSHYSK